MFITRVHQSEINDFFKYILDRDLLAHRKSENIIPWTTDPVLARHKFCNVRRFDDACTRCLFKNVIIAKIDIQDKIFNIILFRRFNTRYFFDYTPVQSAFHFDLEKMIKHLDHLRGKVKLFNNAYTLCQVPYNKSRRANDKHVQILQSMNDLRGRMIDIIITKPTARDIHKVLMFRGHRIGAFLAYQILLDISYIPDFHIENMDSWFIIGPGAMKGIKIIFGDCNKAEEKLCFLHKIQSEYLHFKLSVHDIEFNLCEYRKYYNLLHGIKTRIRKYHVLHPIVK